MLECLGDLQASAVIAERGRSLADGMADSNLLSCFIRNLGVANWGLGQYEQALERFDELLRIAEKEKSESLRLVASGNIGLVKSWMGEKEEAMKQFQKALSIAQQLGDRRNISIAYESLGQIHKEMGDHEKALDYFERALKLAIEQGNRRGEGILYGSIGDLYYDLRTYARAFEYFEKAAQVARKVEDRWSESIWLANIGALHAILGREAKGIGFLEKALEITGQLRLEGSEKICLRELAGAHIRLGNPHVAEQYARKGLEMSRKGKDRENQVWFLTLLGIIALGRKRLEKATVDLERALRIADPAEDRWLVFRAKMLLLRARFLREGSGRVLTGMEELINGADLEPGSAGEVVSLKEEEMVAEAHSILARSLKEAGRVREAMASRKRALVLIEKYQLHSLKRQLT